MAIPSKAEIQIELDKLKVQRNTVRKFSAFGDNNQAKVDAQITVIEQGWDDDDIYAEVEDANQDSALEMRQWLDGEESQAPSSQWEPLCSNSTP